MADQMREIIEKRSSPANKHKKARQAAGSRARRAERNTVQSTTLVEDSLSVGILTSLAERIAQEHDLACSHTRKAIEHARNALSVIGGNYPEITIAAIDRVMDCGSVVAPSSCQPWSLNFDEDARRYAAAGVVDR